MRSAWFRTVLLLAAFSFTVVSCDDDDDAKVVTPASTAGKGGTSSLAITPNHYVADQHGTLQIDSCKIYLKYNAEVAPASTGGYDDSIWVTRKDEKPDGKPISLFEGLKQGTYFIYGNGWDKVRSVKVQGSRVYKITADHTVYDVDVQVFD